MSGDVWVRVYMCLCMCVWLRLRANQCELNWMSVRSNISEMSIDAKQSHFRQRANEQACKREREKDGAKMMWAKCVRMWQNRSAEKNWLCGHWNCSNEMLDREKLRWLKQRNEKKRDVKCSCDSNNSFIALAVWILTTTNDYRIEYQQILQNRNFVFSNKRDLIFALDFH